MSRKLPSLVELAAWALVNNEETYSESQLRKIPNDDDIQCSILEKLPKSQSVLKFLKAFGALDKVELDEIYSQILRSRWKYQPKRSKDTLILYGKRVMCVNKICLTKYGFVCSTTTGRLICYEKDQVKPKSLGKFGKKGITHIHYDKEKIYVVFVNWKVRVWSRKDSSWDLCSIYEDKVALKRWESCSMCNGSYLAYTDGYVMELYKLNPDSSGKIYSARMAENIQNMKLKSGFIVHTSQSQNHNFWYHVRVTEVETEDTLTYTLDTENTGPCSASAVNVTNDSVVVFTGTRSGTIFKVQRNRNTKIPILSIIDSKEVPAEVSSLICTKDRIAACYSDGIIQIFDHTDNLLRTINIEDLRDAGSSPKRIKSPMTYVINANEIKLDMDDSRLLCMDSLYHKVYCWDFSD